MADRSISELEAATQVGTSDLFVLEQSATAKKLTGQTLEDWLLELADGHGGIVSITGPVSSGLEDTYTITMADGSTSTFTVTNGNKIASIAKTGTSGLVDTYTITMTDGGTSTFTVTNGNGITGITAATSGLTTTYTLTYGDGETYSFSVNDGRGISGITWTTSGTPGDGQTHTGTITYNDGTTSAIVIRDGLKGDTGDMSYVWIKWAAAQPTADSDMLDVPAAWIGIYAGTADAAPTAYTDYAWYQYRGDDGANIASITLTSSAGLEDTYTVELTDGSTSTFTVTNGNGIASITGPDSAGLEDTYTITMTDGSTSTFTVTNGNGIASITLTGSSGLTDTYTVAMTNGSSVTFTVTNGNGIASIVKTGTSGLVDTYTVTMTDGSTTTFSVVNGKGIASIAMTSGSHAAGTTDVYTITFNDGDTTTFTVYNGANGTGSVSSVAGIQAVGGDVPLILTGNGPPTSATVGQENQMYFDYNAGTLYICLGESGGAYNWSSTTLTVDSTLSASSTNPVANAAITAKVGTTALNTTAQDLSNAVNEVLADIPAASATTPAMDGTAAVGVGTTWARADHVHPSDTSKANVTDIPEKLSELTNDAGYITSADVPTALSELTNDVGFITSAGTAAKVAHALTVAVPAGTDKTFDGSAAAALGIRDLVYLGNQPITTTANDTPYNWAQLGTGIAYYGTTGLLNGQPEQYGLVLNFATNVSVMHQLFLGIGNNVYTRKGNGGSASNTWSSWERLLEPGDAYYKAGDTFSISSYAPISGIYYSGSHNIWLNVPVSKSLANINTVTVTALKGGITGPSGQLGGSGDSTDWLNSSATTITAYKASDRAVAIRIANSSALSGASTNVVCALDANPITLSFS